jgi:RNA polymerase sigma-70 factor (ECF subfamily)
VEDEPTDSELLSRVENDPAALEHLFRRHRVSVLCYAARRCNDAADLVSLTFLGVLESAGSFDPRRGDARAWILGIAHRQWASMLRREHRSTVIDDRDRRRRHLGQDDIARIDEQIDAAKQAVVVEQVIATLPERHREALWLVGHDG